jgi:alkylation response protein AidB-like acyl-CoA dehydrogenase
MTVFTSTPAGGGPGLALEPTREERLLRDSVSSISRKYGPDYFQRVVDSKTAPNELWKELGDAGFLSVHLPEEYGGGGAGLAELSMVLEETAAAGVPALSAVFSAGVNGTILAKHGTPEQKERWLRPLAERAAMSSFAITEPDAGTNSFAINTWAKPAGEGFVINGMKYYISGMEEAEFVLVVARTGTDERTGRGRLTLFLVDADAAGISRQVIPTALQVPERQSTVYFENVRVSADRVIGTIDHGMKAAFAGINAERLLVSSICIGVGRYALDKAVSYANERSVWGVPIGTHQSVAHPLAESKIAIESAKLMTARACALYDSGVNPGESSNMAKVLGVDAGLQSLDAAIQTHGGNGVALEYQLSNYWFLLRMLKIGPVSKEMVLNFIAEHTLGLPKSY